ncbi:Lysylphosphatidylglycerol synthase-like protein [Rubrivivax sp. A210]|uniref:lysylphosphatidylglycerol synthase domain-containing protein n=1 Tax=Rubrivivax sp. A210 TaxID=2772301 RepID=UPI001918078C|nr:lysylphosphatidylglycerol synthase domain-containing protein [Rubrivivax sp. A210]CAD5370599.1 Lysylphosphatidylglycerol synthase-like protein [Rubrivivax sp. A210]
MKRQILVWLLGGLAALALAWVLPAPAQLWARATALPPLTWLIAALGMGASYTLRALRLRDEWRHRLPVRLAECLHITLVHSAAINVLPMRAGELGFPWLLYKRWGVPVGDSAASLFWLRLQDAAVLGLLGAAVFGPDLGLAPAAAFVLRGTLALALLGLIVWRGASLARAALAAVGGPGGGGTWLARALARVLQAVLRSHARGWLWTLANWLVKIAVLALLLSGIAELPLAMAWAGALAGEGAAVLPIQPPAGFGTYEAGVWVGARLAGATVSPSTVLGAAFTMHLFVIVFSILAAAASHGLQGTPRGQQRTS